LTADFVYMRRHGEFGSYATNYTTEQLKKDAMRIKAYLKLDKDVYMYFNNDAMGYAPKNAMELNAILEKSLPKALKKTLLPAGAKPEKAKPAKKVKKEIKKKKPVKKTRPKKVKAKKALKKKVSKKKVKKKPAGKSIKRKPAKKNRLKKKTKKKKRK